MTRGWAGPPRPVMGIKVRKVLASSRAGPDPIISGAMHSDSGRWTLRRTAGVRTQAVQVPGTCPTVGRQQVARPDRPVRSLDGGLQVVGAQRAGGPGGRGAQRRRDGTPPRFTLSLLRCCYLNACRPPLSSYLSSTTTTLSPQPSPSHTPQQFASRLQIYSTSASPRYLNTPISVRRHLCRPSLPMSIENLKSYGQSSRVYHPIPMHKDDGHSAMQSL